MAKNLVYTFRPKNPMNTDLVQFRRQIFEEALHELPWEVRDQVEAMVHALAKLLVKENIVKDFGVARERAELFFAQVIIHEAPARCPALEVTPAGRKVMVYL